VSSRGNPASGQAGWDATRDERYQDVQCESCHGPGLTHVTNPQATNIPLAPLAVDTSLTRGCGECHNGTHHPFVQEWRQSGHGRVQSSPAGRAECNICHTAENVLLAWGVRANYAEKDSVLGNASAHLAIVCSVCHDPHAKDHEGQLRFPIDAPNEEENLCMRCHHKRGTPDPTTYRGPHSPEGPILLGYGGWWPPSMEFPSDTMVATHGSDRNPRLCAGCHVNRFTVNDPATGNFAFQATGHLFEAIPCLNAQGIPVPGNCSLGQRTFQSCTGAGCHTEASARSAYTTVQNRLQLLTDALAELIDQIPASEFNDKDGRYTTGEGSQFNLELADPDEFPGSGIHNPFLVEALVTSSIKQIELDYGISAPPGLNLNNILQQRSNRK
jgi:predicted CXXCH cytochrome family protein